MCSMANPKETSPMTYCLPDKTKVNHTINAAYKQSILKRSYITVLTAEVFNTMLFPGKIDKK